MGIVTIYQEFNLVPTLTVAENIFMGREPLRLGALWIGRACTTRRERSPAASGSMSIRDISCQHLSVAEQQMVEIARALSVEARLIIMDEPTSALSETEVSRLLAIMRNLRKEGVSIMFVTHRFGGGGGDLRSGDDPA